MSKVPAYTDIGKATKGASASAAYLDAAAYVVVWGVCMLRDVFSSSSAKR